MEGLFTRDLGQKKYTKFLNLGLYLSLPALFPLLAILSQTQEPLYPEKGGSLNYGIVASWVTTDRFLILLKGLSTLTLHTHIHVTLTFRERVGHWKV